MEAAGSQVQDRHSLLSLLPPTSFFSLVPLGALLQPIPQMFPFKTLLPQSLSLICPPEALSQKGIIYSDMHKMQGVVISVSVKAN